VHDKHQHTRQSAHPVDIRQPLQLTTLSPLRFSALLSFSLWSVSFYSRARTGSFMVILAHENHSLRYAIHQLNASTGIVAPTAHQNGSARSATNPSAVNVIQKIFRSISSVYLGTPLHLSLVISSFLSYNHSTAPRVQPR
jgi:hypothetical protein